MVGDFSSRPVYIVYGQPKKRDQYYDNLRVSKNASDSNLLKVNARYVSVNWEAGGGGAFAVIPLAEHGKLPDLMPLFRGHTAAVLDTDWNPFDDSVLASGADDGKVTTIRTGSLHRFAFGEFQMALAFGARRTRSLMLRLWHDFLAIQGSTGL